MEAWKLLIAPVAISPCERREQIQFTKCRSRSRCISTRVSHLRVQRLDSLPTSQCQLNLLLLGPAAASFFEGILFVLFGALLLIGSGGISQNTMQAAMLASAPGGTGEDIIGPSEIYRRDAWKPKGSIRFGLTLIIAGIVLLVIYFVSILICS